MNELPSSARHAEKSFPSYFITGTDTGVGKTFVSTLMIRSLRAQGADAVGMKPICCGDREDAELLHAACESAIPLEDVNPVWLRTPASPLAASIAEGCGIDTDVILETFLRLRREHGSVIVEGAGGWLVPIRRDFLMSDLAAAMALPVVVVIANRIGAINHALLTIRSIPLSGLVCAGVVLNDPSHNSAAATAVNLPILETILDVPILSCVRHGQGTLNLKSV